ncbi:MAG: hypothetical protein LBD04_06205 [Synergistaceae bacterium]|jgi:hypothetical protein|nr:hypothetical protein [Synergistaceae bacterium]
MENKQSYEKKVTRTLMLLKEFVRYVPGDARTIRIGETRNVELDMMFAIYIGALEDCVVSIELGKDIENIAN